MVKKAMFLCLFIRIFSRTHGFVHFPLLSSGQFRPFSVTLLKFPRALCIRGNGNQMISLCMEIYVDISSESQSKPSFIVRDFGHEICY